MAALSVELRIHSSQALDPRLVNWLTTVRGEADEMQRTLLKSKIHRATVTDCDLNYVGSLTIDADLMTAADILPFEAVHVVNVNNGARFQTYAITGPAGSGQMQVNGAAARLVERDDIIIVFSFAAYSETEILAFAPLVVLVDQHNRPVAPATPRTDRRGERKARSA